MLEYAVELQLEFLSRYSNWSPGDRSPGSLMALVIGDMYKKYFLVHLKFLWSGGAISGALMRTGAPSCAVKCNRGA